MQFLPYLHQVVGGRNLTEGEAHEVMRIILAGETTNTLIAAFLTAMKMKGETSEELSGLSRAMRERANLVDTSGLAGRPILDTCGTGGDGGGTFNVSTVAAFVAAGAGVAVAKHGNRSLASKCGSADVLEELGVAIQVSARYAARALRETGMCFLFAPKIHPAAKHAQPARAELKMRTVFNLLGPLCNPANAGYQLIGAPSLHAAELMAGALARMEHIRRAWVVHGEDGMDEITTTAATAVFDVQGGSVRRRELRPEDVGLARVAAADLAGGDRAANAEIARTILQGEPGPKRDIVVLNAGAALHICGMAADLREGLVIAAGAIDKALAFSVLQSLRQLGPEASE